jgi:hypothetical protein
MKLAVPSPRTAPWRRKLSRTTQALIVLTLSALTSARAVEAPPHKISAMNLNVIQNDTGNTANSVTVTSTLSINDMRVRPGSNRGDYNLQVGDTATNDLAEGMVLVTIAENGRDNGELADEQKNYAAPAFDGGASGYWAVIQDVTSARAEYNINCSVAYFRYSDYLCGWARNATGANGGTNNLFTASPGLLLGTHFKGISSGRSRVDLRSLGIYSTNSVATNTGVLLVNHAKNEGNYASANVNADGTWELYVKDNFANGTSLEQDPVAFVYVPKTNTTVVSGRFGLDATGTNAVILLHSGAAPAFAVTNSAIGRFRLTIPGGSPGAGVLVLSSEGGQTLNFDNTVSYEPDGDGWVIEVHDLGTFPPPLESSTNEAVASFVYIPAATAGFAISPTNTLVTSEFGLTASFSVQLDLAPTNDVTISVTSSNPSEGLVSTNALTFNADNWNVPQIVTITGQDDALADGNVPYTIVLAPVSSGDTNYLGLDPRDVQVINVDDEQPGITVTPTVGLYTTEAGGTATFEVFLNRAPAEDVTIGLSSSNTGEGTVAPASLTFTPANWNLPQAVTVTGVDDFRKDGNKAYTIVTAPAVSADASYNGINPADVSVINLDNDNPAIIYNSATPLAVSEGGTTTYTIVLATQPDSNVVITVTSSAPAIGTVAPATITFTPADWSTPKVVTVSGVDNLVPDGTVSFSVNNTVTSSDPLYGDFAGTKVLPAIRLDNETTLVLPSGDCVYGLGMPPIGLDGQAQVADVDATNYDGSVLTVTLTTNGSPADVLGVRDTGSGPRQIAVNGSEISYEGNVIGSFTGGTNLTPLAITLNTNSTVLAVQQLVRSLTFGTVSNGASLLTRSVDVTLNDGLSVLTAGKLVRVGALRLTQYAEAADFGYGEYYGAADTALSEVGHATPWPEGRTKAPQEGLLIDWPDGGTPNESQVLLRFDNFVGTNYWQVPSNAVVVSAELLVYINNTGDGGRLFRMLIPWDATNDTWDSMGEGVQADDVEARSIYESQLGVEDGSGATGTGMVSIGVTPDVQAWVSGQANFGWVIKGWPLMTDGTSFTPSEYADVTQHPRLRVKWLEPGCAIASYRQDVNGYTNAHDTNLRQASPDVNYIGDLSLFVDANDAGNTNATECLLRFDNVVGTATNQVPPGSLIHAAVLELPSVGADQMGDGGLFYAMLQPWDDTTVTWNSYGPNGIQPDGIVAAATPTVVAGNSALNPDVQGTVNSYEVTADVQAWANGTRSNYGWAILPWPNGSNGWGFRTSKFSNVVAGYDPLIQRPQLRVYYSAGVGAVAASLSRLTVSPGQVQVPFTGTAGMTYSILRAPGLSGPWGHVGSATVSGNGQGSYTDSTPLSGGAFYRVVYP